MKNKYSWLLIFFLSLIVYTPFGYSQFFYQSDEFIKSELVIDSLNPRAFPDVSPGIYSNKEIVAKTTILKRLQFLDPKNVFQKFSNLDQLKNKQVSHLEIFSDKESKNISHSNFFQFIQKSNSTPPHRDVYLGTKSTVGERLKGVRIAIDPGHMGTDAWDKLAQKYTMDSLGNRVNEGQIAFVTAHLLKEKFESEGAAVLITRDDLNPATKIPYYQFDLKKYALQNLDGSRYKNWFYDLLTQNPVHQINESLLLKTPQFQKMFSESKRYRSFFYGVDLNARIQKIQNFKPHLSLVIHFDMFRAGKVSRVRHHATKAYVPGNFMPGELDSKESLEFFTHHLLQPHVFEDSVKLTRNILHEIRDQMGIPLQKSHGPNGLKIEPGIFSRNLAMTRKVVGAPVSFLECFFYDDPVEFKNLINRVKSIHVGGDDHHYGPRLDQLAQSIFDGVIKTRGQILSNP